MGSRRFEDRVALVTGGTSGIGEAVVAGFARQGARVVLSDIDDQAGEALARQLEDKGAKAIFVRADVTKAKEVELLMKRAIDGFGRLDYEINVAGGVRSGMPYERLMMQEEDWDSVVDLNLKSAWLCMTHAIPQMIQQGGGAIVNIASLAGMKTTPNGNPAYSAAKAGLIHLSEYAAVFYAKDGIRCNVVAPGLTLTPAMKSHFTPERCQQIVDANHAIPRMATPEEQASAVLYLCSDEAAIVTGVTIPVDGGWAAK